MISKSLLALGTAALAGVEVAAQAPSNFATIVNGQFHMDGSPLVFAGSNAYYWPFNVWGTDHYQDVVVGMEAALDAGLKVVRTWAFHDQNQTTIDGGLPQYGTGAEETVMQFFNPDGSVSIDLSVLDVVIRAAEDTGMKLILALTNNWADYGGMDVYTVNLGGRYHDDFYRMPNIKAAFKNYIDHVVGRYKDSPAVFAWEVANEPRCGADGERNLPRGPDCSPELLLSWLDEMSTHIKSIDPHHLVTTGSEGAFNRDSSDWAYNGSDGNDFDAELALPNIDFGTFHSYPDWWGKTAAWTEQWIVDHADAARAAGKPVIHEEYGWLDKATRVEVLGRWQAISRDELMPDLFWQFGYSDYSTGRNHDDGFTIYLDEAEAQPLVYEHAALVNALLGGGGSPTPPPPTSPPPTTPPPTGTPPPVSPPPGGPKASRWGQCGGIGWNGPTECEDPWVCTPLNDWYHQCL